MTFRFIVLISAMLFTYNVNAQIKLKQIEASTTEFEMILTKDLTGYGYVPHYVTPAEFSTYLNAHIVNIYNADGTLTGVRDVNLSTYDIDFIDNAGDKITLDGAIISVNNLGGANYEIQTTGTQAIVGTSTNHDLLFQTNLLERMRLKSTGELNLTTVGNDEFATKILVLDGSDDVHYRTLSGLGIGANGLTQVLINDNSGSNLDQLNTGYFDFVHWDANDTDIDGLLAGSNFGNIIRTRPSAHGVVGIRENDSGDGFHIISGGGQSGTSYADTDTFSLYVAGFFADGRFGVGTNNPSQETEIVGDLELSNTGDDWRFIEIGKDHPTGITGSYIDFIGDATYSDWGLRIIRNAGENSTDFISHRGTGNFIFENREAANMVFETNNIERVRITAAGKFGVGTSAPLYGKLEVKQSTDAAGEGVSVMSTAGNTMRLWMNGSTANIYSDGSGSSPLILNNTGLIGMGTSTPSAKLDVRPVAYANNQDGGIQLAATTGQWLSGVFLRSDGGGIPRLALDINSIEAVSLQSGGDVGIKTIAPNTSLDVNGYITMRPGAADQFMIVGDGAGKFTWTNPTSFLDGLGYLSTSDIWQRSGTTISELNAGDDLNYDSNTFFVDASENSVGIGTMTPSDKLTIDGDFGFEGGSIRYLGSELNAGELWLLNGGGYASNSGSYVGLTGSYGVMVAPYIAFNTGKVVGSGFGSEAMRIISTGEVGIGTNNPLSKLHVEGGNILAKSSGSTSVRIERQSGNFGFVSFRSTDGTGNKRRFEIGINNGLESGSNAGSNFFINRFSDSDSFLSTSLFINRASGYVGIGEAAAGYQLDVKSGVVNAGGATETGYFKSNYYDGSSAYADYQGWGFESSRSTVYIRPTSSQTDLSSLQFGFNSREWDNIQSHLDSYQRWYFNGTEEMRITAAGLSVGLVSDPLYQLDVNNNIGVRSSNGAALIMRDSDASSGYKNYGLFNSTGKLHFRRYDDAYPVTSVSAEIMTFDNDRVGIGTTSPDVTQHNVSSTSNILLRLEATGASSSFLNLVNTGTTDGKVSIGSVSENMVFYTNGVQQVRLTQAGLLGIGTSSPSKDVDIYRNDDESSMIIQSYSTTGTGYAAYTEYKRSINSGGTQNLYRVGVKANGDFELKGGSSAIAYIRTTDDYFHIYEQLSLDTNDDTGAAGNIRYTGSDFEGKIGTTWYSLTTGTGGGVSDGNGWWTSSNIGTSIASNMAFTIPTYVNMDGGLLYVDGAANEVGIGTTTPSSKLDVVGTSEFSDDMNVDSGTLFVDASANQVGIGTTSPDADLRIDNSSSIALKVTGGNAGTDVAQFIRDIGTTTKVGINGNGTDAQMYFNQGANYWAIGHDFSPSGFSIAENNYLGTNTRFHIAAGGNIGIGNTSPTTKFHVSGTVRADDLQIGTSTIGYVWTATDANGNGEWAATSAGTDSDWLSGTGLWYNNTDDIIIGGNTNDNGSSSYPLEIHSKSTAQAGIYFAANAGREGVLYMSNEFVVGDVTFPLQVHLDAPNSSLSVLNTGQLNLSGYASGGTFIGTAAKMIGVDASGNVVMNDVPSAASEVNDLSSIVTWANVPDANVTESSVTQHKSAMISDAAYDASWNGDTNGATKNAIYDKIETITGDGDGIYDGSGTVPTTTVVTLTDNINFDGNTFYIDGTNNEIGIGTNTPSATLDIVGTTKTDDLVVDNRAWGAFYTTTDGSSTTSTFAKIDFTTQLKEEGQVTVDETTNDRITVNADGDYRITLIAELDNDGTSTQGQFSMYKNGTPLLEHEFHWIIHQGTNIASKHMSKVLTLSDGDYLEVWWRNVSATSTARYKYVELEVIREVGY